MFMNAQLNTSMKKSFETFHSIDYRNYSDKEVFGFVKHCLVPYLGGFVRASVLKLIISSSYKKSDIPRIIKEIHNRNDVYELRNIQALFFLMVYAYRSFYANNITKLCLMNTFIPLFFGKKAIQKLKKAAPENYFLLVSRWNEILKYLPKGSRH